MSVSASASPSSASASPASNPAADFMATRVKRNQRDKQEQAKLEEEAAIAKRVADKQEKATLHFLFDEVGQLGPQRSNEFFAFFRENRGREAEFLMAADGVSRLYMHCRGNLESLSKEWKAAIDARKKDPTPVHITINKLFLRNATLVDLLMPFKNNIRAFTFTACMFEPGARNLLTTAIRLCCNNPKTVSISARGHELLEKKMAPFTSCVSVLKTTRRLLQQEREGCNADKVKELANRELIAKIVASTQAGRALIESSKTAKKNISFENFLQSEGQLEALNRVPHEYSDDIDVNYVIENIEQEAIKPAPTSSSSSS
ncbi:MAG TPA: hypothetical protein VN457_02265, partial [Chlamydiales bacterium]|nr:hypothetical protein [Chlamydiales bacterium]